MVNPAFVTTFELSKQVYVYKHKLYVVGLLRSKLKTLFTQINYKIIFFVIICEFIFMEIKYTPLLK